METLHSLSRKAAGRDESPCLGIIDSRSVKTSHHADPSRFFAFKDDVVYLLYLTDRWAMRLVAPAGNDATVSPETLTYEFRRRRIWMLF